MKFVDIDNWERKEHFNYFRTLDYPHFNICGNIDITKFCKYIKEKEYSFFISFLYACTKTANEIKEFRYRIRENDLIEHEKVGSSFTTMTSKGVFSFCLARFTDDFEEFNLNTLKEMEMAKNIVNLKDEPGKDDLLFITSIPWISFSNITHPIHMKPVDSIPRISWGKYFEDNGRIKLPLSVQAHHALVDGIHMGQYFSRIQEIMDNPEKYL